MSVTFRLEGLNEVVHNLGELPKATRRNVVRRVLIRRAQPIANHAAQLAPHRTGKLAFSVVVSTQLTRRQRRGAKVNEVEVYIGPSAGLGTLYYASFEEFGSLSNPARPFMRPAWDAGKGLALNAIGRDLGEEVEKAAARLARKQG